MPHDDCLRIESRVGRAAGKHLEEHAPQRVDVGASVEVGLTSALFGTHVGRRADRHAIRRQRISTGRLLKGACDTEVGYHRVPVVEKDVRRHVQSVAEALCQHLLEPDHDFGMTAVGEFLSSNAGGGQRGDKHLNQILLECACDFAAGTNRFRNRQSPLAFESFLE